MKPNTIHVSAEMGLRSILCYFVMIPFLHPRGFDEYLPLYKDIFTFWLYAALVIVVFLYIADLRIGRVRYKKSLFYMLCYYALMITITLAIQNGLGEGLQKMIAAPGLCLVCAYYLRHDPRIFLDCLCNLLIIVLGLTVLVFNTLFFGQYFRDDIKLMFIGHVQIGSQLGLLGIFLANILKKLRGRWSQRLKALLGFSIGTMLMSLTSASFLSLFILFIGFIYIKISKQKKLLAMKPSALFFIYLAVNVALLALLALNKWRQPFGIDWLSGRNSVWKYGIALISKHKIFGYGVNGVLIKLLWSPKGFNYAHNQLIQVLLDGGIVLLISFMIMLWSFIQPLKYVEKDVGAIARICLLAIFAVMTAESSFEYYYILIFLSLIEYLPEIMNIKCPVVRMKGYGVEDIKSKSRGEKYENGLCIDSNI